jgi:hypothetical protein
MDRVMDEWIDRACTHIRRQAWQQTIDKKSETYEKSDINEGHWTRESTSESLNASKEVSVGKLWHRKVRGTLPFCEKCDSNNPGAQRHYNDLRSTFESEPKHSSEDSVKKQW